LKFEERLFLGRLKISGGGARAGEDILTIADELVGASKEDLQAI